MTERSELTEHGRHRERHGFFACLRVSAGRLAVGRDDCRRLQDWPLCFEYVREQGLLFGLLDGIGLLFDQHGSIVRNTLAAFDQTPVYNVGCILHFEAFDKHGVMFAQVLQTLSRSSAILIVSGLFVESEILLLDPVSAYRNALHLEL
jgi:hypothetical protein